VDKIYFGVIGSNAVMEIQIKSIEYRTIGTMKDIQFQFDCPVEEKNNLNLMLEKEGWLHISEDLAPLKGQFYKVEFESSPYNYFYDCKIYFKGDYQYLKDQIKVAHELKNKVKTKKESRQKRNIKRKITFN
jgi:hypothetical protein